MWGLICSLSSIDQERNNISLSNVITQVNISKNDFENAEKGGHKGILVNIPHEIVIMFRRMVPTEVSTDDLRTDLKVSLVDSKGGTLGEILNTLYFPAKSKNLGHRINMNSFVVTSKGEYEYRVSLYNKEENIFDELYAIPFTVEDR